MHRLAISLAALLLVPAICPAVAAAQSRTVIGSPNQLLTDGARAMEAGRIEEGLRLTLAGLELPTPPVNAAAAHSNLCAAYVYLKRLDEALSHCNSALELDTTNWRTYNNRAAVFVGMKKFDLAMTDVNIGLTIAPDSQTLLKSREVVAEHQAAFVLDRRRKAKKT
jgi:tetratricopeptide (TPR) repeat protein